MFKQARIKLTIWYVLILAVISLAFSATIYRYLSLEIDRFAKVQRNRIERRFEDRIPEQIRVQLPPLPNFNDPDIVRESKNRIIYLLFSINSIILVVSGFLSYLLSGLTLKPIKEMVEDQDRFVSDASHELRTPLTSLKTSIEVALKDPSLTLPEAKKYLKENLTDVDNLSLLATSLLELSRFQNSSRQLNLDTQPLKQLILSALSNVKTKLQIKKIKVIYKVGNKPLTSDSQKIIELFTILLDNAIKYSPPQSVIRITSSRSTKVLTLKFIDQGIGIDPQDKNKIFDRFYRSDKARTKSDSDGFGLGLSIAKKIISAHLGTLTVESETDHGSTFTVKLPLKK